LFSTVLPTGICQHYLLSHSKQPIRTATSNPYGLLSQKFCHYLKQGIERLTLILEN